MTASSAASPFHSNSHAFQHFHTYSRSHAHFGLAHSHLGLAHRRNLVPSADSPKTQSHLITPSLSNQQQPPARTPEEPWESRFLRQTGLWITISAFSALSASRSTFCKDPRGPRSDLTEEPHPEPHQGPRRARKGAFPSKRAQITDPAFAANQLVIQEPRQLIASSSRPQAPAKFATQVRIRHPGGYWRSQYCPIAPACRCGYRLRHCARCTGFTIFRSFRSFRTFRSFRNLHLNPV